MKMGIIGLPESGKSTVFGIVSGEIGAGAVVRPDKPRLATVKVPDKRVEWLTKHYNPKKTVLTDIELVDFAPIRLSAKSTGATFPPQFLATLRTMDGILVTLRQFEDDNIYHSEKTVDPVRDAEIIDMEFTLADLAVVETKVEKLTKNVARGMKEDAKELALLERVKAHLEDEKPLRSLELSEEELDDLRGFAFLSLKPVLLLLNLDEAQFSEVDKHVDALKEVANGRLVLPLCACIEEEISKLDAEDQAEFLKELKLSEPARDRLIRKCFELMGFIVFFTVGEDEVRAWTLREGQRAVKAAGRIHSDLERGFIRAEVFAYDDLKRLGDVSTVKSEGLWRLEGKEYIVLDGDIIAVRHNS
jgi:hypothetical protein